MINEQTMKTTAEAAQELGVTQTRVRQMILAGEIDAVMRGGSWFITPDQVEKARGRKTKSGPKPKAK
jgi:excisionase family DNA binding protein